MRPFVIGVPTLNRYDLLAKCLQHVFAGTAKPQTVYIVDNGRRLPQGAFAEIGDCLPINVVVPQSNLGVSASWNVLLRLAGNLPMVVMNDDVFVSPTTLATLMEPEPHVIVTALGWSCFRQDPEVRRIIGDYDENLRSYMEDNDYDHRRKLAGVERVIKENDVVVGHGDDLGKPHFPSSTLRKMPAEEMKTFNEYYAKQAVYYRAKWGGIPSKEVYDKPFGGLTPEALAVIREQWRLPEQHGIPWVL